MKKIVKLILLFLACMTVQSVYAAQRDFNTFRLILQWTPQAQFAGYFIAREKGLYRQYGIDLEIIAGGPDKVVSDYLDSGQADFGTMFLATAMERRDAGMPLVNIGQIIHHSSLMLIARAGKGIETIADLDQQKVSLWPNEFQIQPRILFQQAGIEVEIVPLAGSMELFLRGAVAASSAMWYNEYHTILSSGLREQELQTFFFKDTSYDFPEDGIYCLEETLQHNPDAAKAVLKGTLAGWKYAFAHEQEALDIVARHMTEASLPVNKAHQRWMFRRMRDIILRNGQIAENGVLRRETFTPTLQQLLESGAIRTPVDYSIFYRGPAR